MSKDLIIQPGAGGNMAIPAHLQGFASGVGKALMTGVGGLFNRIGLKGNRFRMVVGGQEMTVRDENYVDVVIVGAAPDTQRVYYATKYSGGDDAESLPTCYSSDGKVPAEDVHQKQHSRCDLCPQNEVGSAMMDNGKKTRACGYFRRLAVWVVGDDPDRVFTLDVKAMGLFGESKPAANQFSLSEYAKWCSARGVDPSMIVTRISFDTDQSVPKLLFKPAMYITEAVADVVASLTTSEVTKQSIAIKMNTAEAFETAVPQRVTPAQQAIATPVAAAAPPAPAPAARRARPAPALAPATVVVQQAAPAPAARVAPAPVEVDDADLADILAHLEE